MKDLISIICTSYNHAEFIRETIESIWNQDYKNIEIILVDDGSKDETPKILTELAKQSPIPMELILQENTKNLGLNRNRGFKKAKGEFIVFFDGDDKFAPNILSKLVKKIKEDDNFQFATFSKLSKFGEHITKASEGAGWGSKPSVKNLLQSAIDYGGTFPVVVTLFKKSIIEKVGGFDEDLLGDDIVLCVKILKEMEKNSDMDYTFINEVGFYYRIHENNIHKNSERQCRIIYEVNRRYFPNQKSKILPKWICGASRNYMKNGEFNKACKLFFGEMNDVKIKFFIKFILYFIKYKIYYFFKISKYF